MQHQLRKLAVIAVSAATLALAACGGKSDRQTAAGDVAYPSSSTPATDVPPAATTPTTIDTAAAPHHSKLGGALVGAAAGHMLGHHALAGAAAGALIQHERNKHPR